MRRHQYRRMTPDSLPTFSPRHRFADWPNADIPAVAAGVYVIWESESLIYCGMSGREIEKAVDKSCYTPLREMRVHSSGLMRRTNAGFYR